MTSTAVSRKSIVGEPLVEGGLSSQTGQVQKDNVKVVIRVRPLNERELCKYSPTAYNLRPKILTSIFMLQLTETKSSVL